MSRFDIFLVGNNERLSLDIDAENLDCLANSLGRQRFLLAQLSSEAGEMAFRRVMIPSARINLLSEAD
jgi:hypothetical protein